MGLGVCFTRVAVSASDASDTELVTFTGRRSLATSGRHATTTLAVISDHARLASFSALAIVAGASAGIASAPAVAPTLMSACAGIPAVRAVLASVRGARSSRGIR